MRTSALLASVLILTTGSPAAAQMTTLERQRLVAHLEMTRSWLLDEVSTLSRAQLEFRRAPGTWTILEVIDHLVVVGPIYWQDLQTSLRGRRVERDLSGRDADILWYGIDRTNREPAITSENPRGEMRDLPAALEAYRAHHIRLLEFVRTTNDDLRGHLVERQDCDAYQWALLISTHEQRHILQIREIKGDPRYPRK